MPCARAKACKPGAGVFMPEALWRWRFCADAGWANPTSRAKTTDATPHVLLGTRRDFSGFIACEIWHMRVVS